MALPLASHVGRVVCIPVIHPVQITADVAETVHKVYPCIKGRVVKVVGIPGVHGGTTVVTDLDLLAYVSTTVLHATAIAAVNASTAASTDAALSPTLTAAAQPIADTDYISVDYNVTGGASPTVDGAGCLFYIERD